MGSRTLDQAKKSRAEKGQGDQEGIKRSKGTRPAEDDVLRDILFPIPENLRDTPAGSRADDREERRRESKQQLNVELGEQFGIDLDDVEASLADLAQIQIQQASELEVLRFIAEGIRSMVLQNKVMLDQGSAQSVLLNDIATAVESATDITLSGTNDIDTADEAQPILRSGRRALTRQIIIRADAQNEFPIYFGDSEVDPNDGFMLKPGEWIKLNINYRDAVVYMASEKKGETVHVLGVV